MLVSATLLGGFICFKAYQRWKKPQLDSDAEPTQSVGLNGALVEPRR
ncbi:MAG: hypothetical protein V4754_17180 [Pseudomonadota bacterium]